MSGTNLILTGFMGTGKSTIGRLIAEETGMELVDVDDVIEARFGTIASIFSAGGEVKFQELEREVAADLARLEQTVISTGGQTLLHEANIQTLGASGVVICLVADPDRIHQRLMADPGNRERPMLRGHEPRERIAELLAIRADGYSRFPQLAVDHLGPPEAARAVMELWDRLRSGPVED